MAISFDAIGEKYVTFLAADTAKEGEVCKVSADAAVDVCAQGDCFCGVITQVRGGTASVLMGGYTELPYSGEAPEVGYGKLSANGEGGVQVDENGRAYLIVRVDSTNGTVGLFL